MNDVKKIKKALVFLSVSTLLTLSIYGVISPVLSQPPFDGILTFSATNNTGTELILRLTLDKENYDKGETVQIWCAVSDPENTPIESGAATIQISCQDWRQQRTVQIVDGIFSYNYIISYGDPDGNWVVTVTAEDNLGNSGTAAENITVTIPTHVYYTVQFTDPVAGLSYTRGENVRISVEVSEGGVAVDNAEVSFNNPTGEKIVLDRTAPGTYSTRYTIRWDDPLANWHISTEAKKTVENVLKAGGSWISIQIKPATFSIVLLSPTQRTFTVGESIEVEVQISYPDGEPVENLLVSIVTPRGENLGLVYEESGIYGVTYSFSSEDVGSWHLEVAVTDSSGNSGSKVSIINIVQPGAVETVLSRYWWALLSIIVAAGGASVYVFKRSRSAGRLDRIKTEMVELDKLEKDAVIRYFKEGSLSRSAFDRLIRKFERRRAELTTEKGILEAKMRKKTKKKKTQK